MNEWKNEYIWELLSEMTLLLMSNMNEWLSIGMDFAMHIRIEIWRIFS